MDIDRQAGVLRPTEAESKYANIGSAIPIEDADLVLGAVLKARGRTNAMDPSEFPHGAQRNQLLSRQQHENNLAGQMIDQLEPFVAPEVVEEAEALLRGE